MRMKSCAAGSLAPIVRPSAARGEEASWSSRLRRQGWVLGIATGKSDRGLAHCLSVHGLSDHFVTLQTADRHPSKPHPAMLEAALFEAGVAPAAAVMIGDTAYDMALGSNAGVRAVGVDWGYHDPAELIAAGAAAVARHPAHLLELLQ